MWSSLLKVKEGENSFSLKKERDISCIPIKLESVHERLYKTTIDAFVNEHRFRLDYLYNKHFKGYGFINKKDFYIFAYYNSTVDERISRLYKRYSRE